MTMFYKVAGTITRQIVYLENKYDGIYIIMKFVIA